MGLTVITSSSTNHPKNALMTDQMRLDVQGSAPSLLHCIDYRGDVALGDHMRQHQAERRRTPLRPIGAVTRRGRLRSPALVVNSHARTPSLLGFLPTDKPFVATNAAHRHTGRQFDGLLRVVCRQEMRQAPASLCVRGQILREIRSRRDLTAVEGHPQAPPSTRELSDRAGPLDTPAPPSICHHDHRPTGEPNSAVKTRKDTPALFRGSCLYGDSTVSPVTWALGGGDGIRTHGLYIANVALCQLSYTPDEGQG